MSPVILEKTPDTVNTIQLRDYQRQCLHAILSRYREGIRRQLVCLPTGSGKTVIFADFPRYFQMKNQMLVLAHRQELLDQAREKIRRANPDLRVEIEQAGRKADPDCDVVVASVPTLGRKGSRRLSRMDPDRFYLIVVDEAHHSTAATYKRVLNHFGVFDEDTKKLVVGFTATPKRGDGQGLEAVYQEITFSRDISEMIAANYLAPLAGYRVETDVDLSRVRRRMGDFVTSQLAAAVNIGERNDLVVDVYRRYLEGRPTLCFCVDVAHVKSVTTAFRKNGIPAAGITGEMERSARESILRDFRNGKIRVLANCMVLTEGYDEPSVSGIILARPTQSALLYTQMIGRGTRLYPGKENVTVVDVVDATRDHSLTTLPELFGLSGEFDLQGHTTDYARSAMEWARAHRPWVDVESTGSIDDLRYRCQKIDLMCLETPAEIKSFSRFAWVRSGKGCFRLGLSDGNAITITRTILDNWEVSLRHSGRDLELMHHKSVPEAIESAETYVAGHLPDAVGLVLRDTRWRRQPATIKQIQLLKKKHIDVPDGITKGQASHLIGMLPV
ncbi:MAG: DEAD/DEAH box helicase [Desulfobacteraceae bacterium]|nr:DEAD/DEAH box helicase [Desulfobacteraceae bacterium]